MWNCPAKHENILIIADLIKFVSEIDSNFREIGPCGGNLFPAYDTQAKGFWCAVLQAEYLMAVKLKFSELFNQND